MKKYIHNISIGAILVSFAASVFASEYVMRSHVQGMISSTTINGGSSSSSASNSYEEYSETSDWINDGPYYDCSEWAPNANTVELGQLFLQSRSCSQNQTSVTTNYKRNNSTQEVVVVSQSNNSQSIDVSESRNVSGTLTFDFYAESTNWTNDGNSFNCGSWSPDVSTIASGAQFEQSRNCDQNQIRTTTNYKRNNVTLAVETVSSTQESQKISIVEKQSAVGTKPLSVWSSLIQAPEFTPAPNTPSNIYAFDIPGLFDGTHTRWYMTSWSSWSNMKTSTFEPQGYINYSAAVGMVGTTCASGSVKKIYRPNQYIEYTTYNYTYYLYQFYKMTCP